MRLLKACFSPPVSLVVCIFMMACAFLFAQDDDLAPPQAAELAPQPDVVQAQTAVEETIPAADADLAQPNVEATTNLDAKKTDAAVEAPASGDFKNENESLAAEEKVAFDPEPLSSSASVKAAELFDPDSGESNQLPSGASAEQAFGDDLKPEDLASLQKQVRMQASEVQGLQAYDRAIKAKVAGNYNEAVAAFLQALELIPKRPQTVVLRQGIRGELADCEYSEAVKLYSQGKWTESEDAAKRALSYNSGHQKAVDLIEKIQRQSERAKLISERPVPIAKQDEFVKQEQRIQTSMRLGRQYAAIGEYEKAKIEFKKIIMEDPENIQARDQLRKISEDEYNIYSLAAETTMAGRMVEVREKWSSPASRDRIGRESLLRQDQPEIGRTGSASKISEKLNRIKIKEINFRDASIVDVVDFLIKASREGDVTSAPNERGINIILNFRRPGESAAMPQAAPIPPTDEFFAADDTGAQGALPPPTPDLGIPRITLVLQNVVLMEAIRYITELTGLKYRLEESAVVITPADVVYGQVVTRVYTVQPSLIEMTRSESSTAVNAGDFDFGGSASTTEARHDVKRFFVEAGVPFPEGTSIIYKPSMNKLLVSNTPDNLEQFERILAELNVVPTQVEIEARFVEIGQNDLEEIGMEWLLTDNWEIAENANSSIMSGGRERIQVNRTDFTRGLRFLNPQGTPIGQTGGKTSLGNILSVSSILTNPEVSFILHAIQQRSGANLLSAPKITTKSGQNAEIKVIKELRYPTDWEQNVQAASTGGGSTASQTTRVIVSPTDFETRDVGVILNVTPMVGPDGYTIDLTVLPQVVEITEWIDYGQDQFDESGRAVGHLSMYSPIFHVRTIATAISIWDGETVVMGGLITEAQSTTEDKIPLLGDIPLLGRLFRSKTSLSQKRNLLIFVTARLVDPAGRVTRKPDDQASALSEAAAH